MCTAYSVCRPCTLIPPPKEIAVYRINLHFLFNFLILCYMVCIAWDFFNRIMNHVLYLKWVCWSLKNCRLVRCYIFFLTTYFEVMYFCLYYSLMYGIYGNEKWLMVLGIIIGSWSDHYRMFTDPWCWHLEVYCDCFVAKDKHFFILIWMLTTVVPLCSINKHNTDWFGFVLAVKAGLG
jgi:hypothetical protein